MRAYPLTHVLSRPSSSGSSHSNTSRAWTRSFQPTRTAKRTKASAGVRRTGQGVFAKRILLTRTRFRAGPHEPQLPRFCRFWRGNGRGFSTQEAKRVGSDFLSSSPVRTNTIVHVAHRFPCHTNTRSEFQSTRDAVFAARPFSTALAVLCTAREGMAVRRGKSKGRRMFGTS